MLTIRRATERDALAMMRVHREAVFAKAAGHYPHSSLEDWAPGATPYRVARLKQEIIDADIIALIAEAAARLSALLWLCPRKTNCGLST